MGAAWLYLMAYKRPKKEHTALEVAMAMIDCLNKIIVRQEERIQELEAIIFQE